MGYQLILLSFLCILSMPHKGVGQYTMDDWEERDTWMKVPELMRLADVTKGDVVADVGCHEGYFTFHLAEEVGVGGRVYAVDVQEYRLERLKRHVAERRSENIEIVLGEEDDPRLPPNQFDAVFLLDVYHEMAAHAEILRQVGKALKPGGHLLLLEKLKAPKRGKSREEQVAAHTLSSHYVRRELEEAGFRITEYVEDFGIWNHEEEKRMWILVAHPENNP